eukprot:gene7043-6685_t
MATPTGELVFRSLGKRGGRGHTFSSDDAKRAAKAGLTAATGLSGSSSKADSHFDVLAQVHCNRFWLGLRLNRTPFVIDQPEAGAGAAAGDAGPCKQAGTRRQRQAAGSAEAPLLSAWQDCRLRELGLDRPRDARDAVAPRWELPLGEQRLRKHKEMVGVVAKLLASSGPAASAPAEAEAGWEAPGEARAAPVCSPIRNAEGCPLRNTCEFHVGRDRGGRPCCGFRLGLGGGQDGVAVGPAEGVPFVPAWMSGCADVMTRVLRDAEPEPEAGAEGQLPLPYTSLRLRGSLRTGEGVAVLTACSVGSSAGTQASSADGATLALQLANAAAEHGQKLVDVLLLDSNGGGPVQVGGTPASVSLLHQPGESPAPADSPSAPPGTITETLASGLRLQVAPLSFFQTSTDSADVLFRTVAELALGGM